MPCNSRQALQLGHSKVGFALGFCWSLMTWELMLRSFPPQLAPFSYFFEACRSLLYFCPFLRFDLNWAALEINRGGQTAMGTDTVIT